MICIRNDLKTAKLNEYIPMRMKHIQKKKLFDNVNERAELVSSHHHAHMLLITYGLQSGT